MLIRRTPIDGALQSTVSHSLRQCLLNVSYHSLLSSHLGQCCKFESMQKDYYWPIMDSKGYKIVSSRPRCSKIGTTLKHKRHLQFFPATRLLQFVRMDIFNPRTKTRKANQHVVITTDRYPKQTRAVPTATITTTVLAYIFYDAWVVLYTIPSYFPTDNDIQFVSKRFGTLCNLGSKHMSTTAYHRHANRKVRRYNKTIVAHKYHYVTIH